ncbi:MAG TPA: hypothetical protein VNO70_07555 [Blastocatellia bacterium]|nr:hypothetical protein [Blastocatellia bacterium]
MESVAECWFRSFRPEGEAPDASSLAYRPAALIELRVNFRSLRAGLNHSEERSYTAWIPQRDMAIDWGTPAVIINDTSQLTVQPDPAIPHMQGEYATSAHHFRQYEAELVDVLARSERLKVYHNPVFGLFSAPEDPLEHFLARVAEAALSRIEPELKRLRSRFELQLEQIREAHLQREPREGDARFARIITNKLHLFKSENRLAEMFSSLAGSVFDAEEARARRTEYPLDEVELREELDRVEQEADAALQSLYDEYRALASEYDIFEIGLQPDNIQVTRRMLLWVPVRNDQEAGSGRQ